MGALTAPDRQVDDVKSSVPPVAHIPLSPGEQVALCGSRILGVVPSMPFQECVVCRHRLYEVT